MLVIAAALLMQAPAAAPLKIEWLARPGPREFAECVPGALPPGQTQVALQCRTALRNKLEGCRVVGPPIDPRVTKTALCAAKHFRARVTDDQGQPVVGVEITPTFSLGFSQSAP